VHSYVNYSGWLVRTRVDGSREGNETGRPQKIEAFISTVVHCRTMASICCWPWGFGWISYWYNNGCPITCYIAIDLIQIRVDTFLQTSCMWTVLWRVQTRQMLGYCGIRFHLWPRRTWCDLIDFWCKLDSVFLLSRIPSSLLRRSLDDCLHS